jgi:hypothetical protein
MNCWTGSLAGLNEFTSELEEEQQLIPSDMRDQDKYPATMKHSICPVFQALIQFWMPQVMGVANRKMHTEN